MTDAIPNYAERYPELQEIAGKLTKSLEKLVVDIEHIDRVSARAKSPDRFEAKAKKVNEDGNPKYLAPLEQIQDQIGARITVFYMRDVQIVVDRILEQFRAIEDKELIPESSWSFGYFGKHLILAMRKDETPPSADAVAPRFFELQVKTLFQHAWAEANHDLVYKAGEKLSDKQYRLCAYGAAQAWGADCVFEQLCDDVTKAEAAPAQLPDSH